MGASEPAENADDLDPSDIVDLEGLIGQWGREFAIERELADLGTGSDATWISLAEAERQVGISRSTLRAWYRSGQIASRLMPGPHGLQRLVPLDAVLARTARSPRTGAGRPPSSSAPVSASSPEGQADTPHSVTEEASSMGPTGLTTPDAVVRLAELATATATERALAAEARLADAEARAAQAETALRAAIERAASAEAEIRLLRDR